MLCPREPDERLQAKIDRLGLTAVVFDPCFTVGAGQDFLTVMAANRARLERALR